MSASTTENKSLLYLHKYDRKAAAYRYRFELFFKALREKGFQLHSQPLLNDAYLESLFNKNSKPWSLVFKGYINRFIFLMSPPEHDLKIVYMELFPKLPYFLEKIFLKKNSYILELDDAYFLTYAGSLLDSKVPQLMKNAKAVIVGSHYLKAYAEQWNSNTVLIPTVIEKTQRKTCLMSSNKKVTIGWMGSPSTSTELKQLKLCFQKLEKKFNVQFLFVGSPKQNLGLENVEFRTWSEETQEKDLEEMDIGIMPLQDTDWNKGKCGFKLIQYMSKATPVVTSPVGENKEIVSEGQTGFFATTDDDWFQAISRLAESTELRQTMGGNAIENIKQRYSLQAVLECYLALLRRCL